MDTVVRTRLGSLRGSSALGIHVFRGVPFAAPSVGPNRFRAPQPVEAWSGVRDALSFGARPLQLRPPPDVEAMVPDPSPSGDDCLSLNIWSRGTGGEQMPVMVWVPGGAFEFGSGASYDGSRFARDGVVCVTINYRVGAEGFLYLGAGEANFGLLDQIAALTWIRDNIAAFGGDPDNVTIFGESAGAMCIGALLAMPAASGLFRRAILQSGGTHSVMSAESAEKITAHFAKKLGVRPVRDDFAGVPPARILTAQTEIKSDILACPDPAVWGAEVVATSMAFHTVIDGEQLPKHPIKCIAAGASGDVDVIAGWNKDDWRLFVVAGGLYGAVTEKMLLGQAREYGFKCLAAYGLTPSALGAYRAAYPGATPSDLLAAVETDYWCRMPALRLADARASASARTFLYEFAWPSPAAGGLMGACHGLEIPFVFDTLDKGGAQMLGLLLGAAPPQSLADAMHGAWVAFAKTGNPGWPKFDPERRQTMRFDVQSASGDDPRAWERDVWRGIR